MKSLLLQQMLIWFFKSVLPIRVSRLKSSVESPQIELLLLDPKTHSVLWTLGQDVSVSHAQIGRNHALEEAIGKLIGDLKALTTQPAPAAK